MSFVFFADVATEKTQKAVLEGVEGFDTGKLKHTKTEEKNPLPDKSGNYFFINRYDSHSYSLFPNCY